MRAFLAALLFLLPLGALADAVSVSQCPVVRERSHNRIACSLLREVYRLEYSDKLTHHLVQWSGRYQDMVDALCQEAQLIIESIDGHIIHVVRCPAQERL